MREQRLWTRYEIPSASPMAKETLATLQATWAPKEITLCHAGAVLGVQPWAIRPQLHAKYTYVTVYDEPNLLFNWIGTLLFSSYKREGWLVLPAFPFHPYSLVVLLTIKHPICNYPQFYVPSFSFPPDLLQNHWHNQQDLLISMVAEPSIPQADSDEVHEMWLPINLWHPVVVLLLQWAFVEASEDPVAIPAALEMAVSHVLDSENCRSSCWVAWLFLQAMQLQYVEELALQAQLHHMRTLQTTPEAKLTKLAKKSVSQQTSA
jgi:hypothetical protein